MSTTALALAVIWATTFAIARIAGRFWGIVLIAGMREWPASLLPGWLSPKRLQVLTALEIAGVITATVLAGMSGMYAVAAVGLVAFFLAKHYFVRQDVRRWLEAHREYESEPGAEDYR